MAKTDKLTTFKVKLELDSKGAVTKINGMKSDLAGMSEQGAQSTETLGSGFKNMAIGIGVATTALYTMHKAFSFALETGKELQTDMANVATLTNLSATSIENLTEKIRNLSRDVPASAPELAKGLYQVVSAGVDASFQLEVLKISAMSASAGVSTTTEALNLGSAVIKAYGKDWSEFASIQDMAFKTVELGQTTFGELASSMMRVTASANELGISTQELFGAFATLTGVTGNTAEVSTQLKAIMTSLIKPKEAMIELAKKEKFASVAEMVAKEGLIGTLKLIAEATDGNIEQLGQMVESSEALTALSALLGSQYENLIEKTDLITQSSGAMNDAFDKQKNTFENQYKLLKNNLTPAFTSFMGVLTSSMGVLNKWVEVPISDRLEDERIAINGLVSAIISSNDEQEIRQSLLDELIDSYPAYFGKLDAEKTKNSELLTVLKEVNETMLNKVLITRRQEELGELYKKQADASDKLRASRKEMGVELENQQKLEFRGNKLIFDQKLGVLEQADELLKQMKVIEDQTLKDVTGDGKRLLTQRSEWAEVNRQLNEDAHLREAIEGHIQKVLLAQKEYNKEIEVGGKKIADMKAEIKGLMDEGTKPIETGGGGTPDAPPKGSLIIPPTESDLALVQDFNKKLEMLNMTSLELRTSVLKDKLEKDRKAYIDAGVSEIDYAQFVVDSIQKIKDKDSKRLADKEKSDAQRVSDNILRIKENFIDKSSDLAENNYLRQMELLDAEVILFESAEIKKHDLDLYYNAKKRELLLQTSQYFVQVLASSTKAMADAGMIGGTTAKRMAQLEATVTAFVMANKAYSAGLSLPPPASLVIAPIMAGLALASGLANVRMIEKQKFALGGAITSPTLALIGEAGDEEFVAPKQQFKEWATETMGEVNMSLDNEPVVNKLDKIESAIISQTFPSAREIANAVSRVIRGRL